MTTGLACHHLMDTLLGAAGNGPGPGTALHVTWDGRASEMPLLVAVGWGTWDRLRGMNVQLPKVGGMGAGRKFAA